MSTCPGKLMKQAAIMVFAACLTDNRPHLNRPCVVSQTTLMPFVCLTCSCGAGCILVSTDPLMVASTCLQSSTVQLDDVRKLINSMNLMCLSMPYSRSMMTAGHVSVRRDEYAMLMTAAVKAVTRMMGDEWPEQTPLWYG